MADSPARPFPFPAPTPAEAAALAVAAAYLARAGTMTASLLLGQWSPPETAALLAALRDNLLAGAAICDGFRDLPPNRARPG